MAADDVRADLAAVALAHMRTATSGCHCGGMHLGESYPKHLADALLPVVDSIAREAAEKARREGYEQARRDFQFQPEGDNHHNAALCPYCTPGARAEAADGGEGQ